MMAKFTYEIGEAGEDLSAGALIIFGEDGKLYNVSCADDESVQMAYANFLRGEIVTWPNGLFAPLRDA
jgi:hypothetical protein